VEKDSSQMNEPFTTRTQTGRPWHRLRGSGSLWRLSVVCFLVVILPALLLFELEAWLRFGRWNLLKERPTFQISFLAICFLAGFFVVLVSRGVELLGASRPVTGTISSLLALALMAYPMIMPIFYVLPFCVLYSFFSTIAVTYQVLPTQQKRLPDKDLGQ
jgi:hypothetical protein